MAEVIAGASRRGRLKRSNRKLTGASRFLFGNPLPTSEHAYDGDNLVEETNSAGAAVARYSQGLNIDEPLAMLRSGTTSYCQADGLGSLTSLSNTSGTLASTYTYDSFGNLVASSGSILNNFRYAGREFDPETSLYYYRARYYDPATGRFISEDPMRFFESPDFYTYVENNPLNLIDTMGLQAQRPSNLPLGTPQQYWGPFSDGFNEALNRLNNAKCAEQFAPSCHEGPDNSGANQMRNTEYRFVTLPQGPGTGAQTVDSTHVQLNIAGAYMLLFDENLSVRLASVLADVYPGLAHVHQT